MSTHSPNSKNSCDENENPTRTILEQKLASLDNGNYTLSFPSGMAAQSCLIATLKAGDCIICANKIYSGTLELFRETAKDLGLKVEYIDTTKPDEVRKALKANTKMVWVETPSNPMMLISDIKAIADIVHNHHESNAIFLVDNTLLSCYFQRPLDFGADAVLDSVTKFINGHNDVLM